ncbi:MAG: hypothetical protein K1X53_03650 [Candidatus Sumerlaeaceae bacterium]|nr:hypothetical protein [Candidatus Sumerlaeaceae bacterium]
MTESPHHADPVAPPWSWLSACPPLWRTAALAAATALLLRIIAVTVIGILAHEPWSAVMAGHDGGEYLSYASALTRLDLNAVPEDARRHSPGWPMAISLASLGLPPWLAACATMWICACGSLFLFGTILQRHSGLAAPECRRAIWGFALVYPAWLYYQCFALGEAAFVFLLLAATLAYLSPHRLAGYALVGLAALVRPPGALLALAFAANDLREGRRWHALWPWTFALIPQLVWGLATRAVWGATFLQVHRPHFGLPFSGFQEIHRVGTFRAIYVIACVAFFVITAALLLREAARSRWANPLVNVAAFFSGAFLLFHLCLRDLFYHGNTIYTFNYQDRYLLGALPFAMMAMQRLWTWPVAAAGGAASLGLGIYWGINYFAAAG